LNISGGSAADFCLQALTYVLNGKIHGLFKIDLKFYRTIFEISAEIIEHMVNSPRTNIAVRAALMNSALRGRAL
jgi:hypothetical protein